jgi:hypothetical protein
LRFFWICDAFVVHFVEAHMQARLHDSFTWKRQSVCVFNDVMSVRINEKRSSCVERRSAALKMPVDFSIMVFCVMTPCSVLNGYRCLAGT